MDPITGAAIITAGGSLINSLFGSSSQSKANKANMQLAQYSYEQQKQMAETAYQRDIEMMDRYNAYNAPAAQMERLASAGLNPNLVYGSGNVAGNQSGQVKYQPPKYEAPTMKAYTGWNLGISDAVQVAMQGRMQRAQVSNMEAQNDYIKQQAVSEGFKQANMAASTARSQFDLGLAKELKETSVQAAKANLDKIHNENTKIGTEVALNMARAALIPLQKELTKAQMEQVVVSTARLRQEMDFARFEQDLKRIGIYPNDPLWARILSRIWKDSPPVVGSGYQDEKHGKVYKPGLLW